MDSLREQQEQRSEEKERKAYHERELHALMEANLELKSSNTMLQLQVERLSQTVEELDAEIRSTT